MLMTLCMSSHLYHITLPAKNGQNPPHGFRYSPLAAAWQPESERGPGGMDDASLCDVTYGDVAHHWLSQG